MKPTYTLINGEEMHATYPDTFWIPSQKVRDNLTAGTNVKLGFKVAKGDLTERMWVIVDKKNEDGSYEGRINNDPAFIRAKYLDKVHFSACHVINIE